MQSRCKLAEMVISFLVEVKTSFFHRFSIIYPIKKSQLQWIVPGIGPGAAITITGDATPDQVAAGVAVEAEAAAGGPEALPAVEEIHRSSLEKGQGCQVHQVDEIFGFLHRSSVQLDGCWMILAYGGFWQRLPLLVSVTSFRLYLAPQKLMVPISNWGFKRVFNMGEGSTGYELLTYWGSIKLYI